MLMGTPLKASLNILHAKQLLHTWEMIYENKSQIQRCENSPVGHIIDDLNHSSWSTYQDQPRD